MTLSSLPAIAARPFVWLATSPVLALMFWLAVALPFGLGTGFGIPHLFWGSTAGAAFLAGLGLGLLLAELGVIGFIFDHGADPLPSPDPAHEMVAYVVGIGSVALLAMVLVAATRGSVPTTVRLALPLGVLTGMGVGVVTLSLIDRLARRGPWRDRLRSADAGDPNVHVLAGAFLALYVLLFLLLKAQAAWAERHGGEGGLPPALALGVLLAMAAAVYGFGSVWIRHRFPESWPSATVALIVLAVAMNGAADRGYRFRGLDYDKEAPVRELLLDDTATLEAWKVSTGARKPILVATVVDGGALRAGYWVAVVLDVLEQRLPSLPRRMRFVTGASGGMLGATHYVASLEKDLPPGHGARVVTEVGPDGLAPLVSALVFHDVWPAPWARNPMDRGLALEMAWERNTKGILSKPLSALRKDERDGWRPSLVFTPMIAEAGGRLVIANLDLADVLRPTGAGRPDDPPFSGYQLGTSLPLGMDDLKLSTAIRMNAAFPFVAPPAALPEAKLAEDRIGFRLVDAGYYDEQGLNLACLWLFKHRNWILDNTAGVFLLQTRDTPQNQPSRLGRKLRSVLRRGAFDLTTPLEAALASLNRGMQRRNDEQVAALAGTFAAGGKDFFRTSIFSLGEEASLSWRLTEEEKRMIRLQMAGGSLDNARELEALEAWWASRAEGVGPGR